MLQKGQGTFQRPLPTHLYRSHVKQPNTAALTISWRTLPFPKPRPRTSDKCASDSKLTLSVNLPSSYPDCWEKKGTSRIQRRAKMCTKERWRVGGGKKASGRMRNSGTHSSVHVSREIWDPCKRQAADAAWGRSAWSPGSCLDYKNASWAASQDLRTQRKALLTDPAAHGSASLSLKLLLIVKITPHYPTHACCHTPENNSFYDSQYGIFITTVTLRNQYI